MPDRSQVLHFFGRVGLTLVLVLATLLIYQHINAAMTPRFDLALGVDAMIPFWPWTWLVYVSFYAMLPFAAVYVPRGEWTRTMAAMLSANVVCWAFFLLLPAHYPRPSLDGVAPAWLASAMGAMWHDDLPGNTFPSIHVAMSSFVGIRLMRVKAGAVWLTWCALIALSTLTVKQHFVVDVVGGVALALGVNALFFPARARP